MAKAAAVPLEALLGISDVEAAVNRNRTTLWRWVRAGKFPAPGYVGNRRVWRESVVRGWLEAELARATSPASRAANLYAVRPSAALAEAVAP